MRNVHGGCYMPLADYYLFAIAWIELREPGLNGSFGCEFLDAAKDGDLIECGGE